MTVGVYGGSFDPPHIAHVLAVKYVLSVGLVSRVVVVPVFEHAFEKNLSPFELRVALCEAAFRDDSRVQISEIERDLPRPSFTFHTISALREQLPGEGLRLIIGADVLSDTEHWHRFDEVERLAPPLVLGRSGVDSKSAPPALLPHVSSTAIRKWFREQSDEAQGNLRRLVPAGVRRLVECERLYR